MNKLIYIFIIIVISLKAWASDYEENLEKLWFQANKELTDIQINSNGYFPKNIKEYLFFTSHNLNKNETILLFYYPRGCGFDSLVDDSSNFLSCQELKHYIKELKNFNIIICENKRHLCFFNNHDELNGFIEKTFNTYLKRDLNLPLDSNGKIIFPSKFLIIQLEKD